MFGNPKDDPWANKRGGDDDDDWDTDPDFEVRKCHPKYQRIALVGPS